MTLGVAHKINQAVSSVPPKAGIPFQKPSYNLPQALYKPFETLSAENNGLTSQPQFTFSAMLYKTSSIFMQVGSQSCPKRMTTTRSSSERMAWSTCQPLCKCGNMYDILQGGWRACGTTATAHELTDRPAFPRHPRHTPTGLTLHSAAAAQRCCHLTGPATSPGPDRKSVV